MVHSGELGGRVKELEEELDVVLHTREAGAVRCLVENEAMKNHCEIVGRNVTATERKRESLEEKIRKEKERNSSAALDMSKLRDVLDERTAVLNTVQKKLHFISEDGPFAELRDLTNVVKARDEEIRSLKAEVENLKTELKSRREVRMEVTVVEQEEVEQAQAPCTEPVIEEASPVAANPEDGFDRLEQQLDSDANALVNDLVWDPIVKGGIKACDSLKRPRTED